VNHRDEHICQNLYNDKLQDQLAYETLRKIYVNTESMIMRHVAENAMTQLLRKGVQPCRNK